MSQGPIGFDDQPLIFDPDNCQHSLQDWQVTHLNDLLPTIPWISGFMAVEMERDGLPINVIIVGVTDEFTRSEDPASITELSTRLEKELGISPLGMVFSQSPELDGVKEISFRSIEPPQVDVGGIGR